MLVSAVKRHALCQKVGEYESLALYKRSVAGGVFSAAADVFVEHARFPAAVCALPDLLFGGARLVAGTSSDVLGVVEAIRAHEAWPA